MSEDGYKLLIAATAYCEARDAELRAIASRNAAGIRMAKVTNTNGDALPDVAVDSCENLDWDARPCWRQWDDGALPDRSGWCDPCLQRQRLHDLAASLRAKRVALQGVMLQIWRAGRT